MSSIRKTVATTLYQAALEDDSIVAMTADLAESVGFDKIREHLPKQFVEVGIAEQELMSMAAGFSLSGKKPVVGSYAAFHPGRNWDQLRTSVCYNHTPVRIISSHYGLSVGGDGATHQCLEYLALTLCLPNLEVLLPFNTESGQWCTHTMLNDSTNPTVLFQPRAEHDNAVDKVELEGLGEFGFARLIEPEDSSTLVITGGLISEIPTQAFYEPDTSFDILFLTNLTKLDKETLAKYIYNHSKIIIMEEHQKFGGLGSIVFEIMSQYKLARDVRHVCIRQRFGKSARDGKLLWDNYHIGMQTLKQHLVD